MLCNVSRLIKNQLNVNTLKTKTLNSRLIMLPASLHTFKKNLSIPKFDPIIHKIIFKTFSIN